MLTIKDFIAFLRTKFPDVQFYNSTINKTGLKSVSIYRKAAGNVMAIGGPDSSSYDILPISILVHWTEDASQCEAMANAVFTELQLIIKKQTPSGKMISFIQLQDASPVWVGRDSNNIAEHVIRANIIYERGA